MSGGATFSLDICNTKGLSNIVTKVSMAQQQGDAFPTPRTAETFGAATDLSSTSLVATNARVVRPCPVSARSFFCLASRWSSLLLLAKSSMYRGPILCLCNFIAVLNPSVPEKTA